MTMAVIDLEGRSWYILTMIRLVVIFTAIVFLSPSAFAEIYKYITDDGVIVFTDCPANKEAILVSTAGKNQKKAPAEKKNTWYDNLKRYYPIVRERSEELAIDPELIKALITVESNWSPVAVSSKGAMGLMQLMPLTAQYLAVQDPFNPEENISGGIKYLRLLLDYFKGNIRHALAAYNAGPTRVIKTAYFPPGSETKNYVEKILRIYGGEHKFKYRPLSRPLADEAIYKMVLEDGTLLFTNTLPVAGLSYQ